MITPGSGVTSIIALASSSKYPSIGAVFRLESKTLPAVVLMG